jgi:hypothetical protein
MPGSVNNPRQPVPQNRLTHLAAVTCRPGNQRPNQIQKITKTSKKSRLFAYKFTVIFSLCHRILASALASQEIFCQALPWQQLQLCLSPRRIFHNMRRLRNMALTVSFDVVTFHPGKIVLAEPETSGQPASGSFRACFHGSLLFRIPKSKSSAAQPHGERTPLACGFRRLAENLVPQTFSRPNRTKKVRRRFGRAAQTGTRAACAAILISEFGFIAPRVKAGTDFTSAPTSLSA